MRTEPEHSELEELLTVPQVGLIFQRHPRTVRNMARAGLIPVVRLGRRGMRFRPQDVRAFIDAQVREAGD